MLGLKRFLTFVADKGKKLVKDLFVKKKDTVDHLVCIVTDNNKSDICTTSAGTSSGRECSRRETKEA